MEVQPCVSGWCGKTIEDEEEGPHITATERMCLQRPPSDGKERCSKTFFSNSRKSFYMCFCKGDLCNAASPPPCHGESTATLFSVFGLVLILCLYQMNEWRAHSHDCSHYLLIVSPIWSHHFPPVLYTLLSAFIKRHSFCKSAFQFSFCSRFNENACGQTQTHTYTLRQMASSMVIA